MNIGGTLFCTAVPLAEVATNENEAPGDARWLADVLDDWQRDIDVSLRTAVDRETAHRFNHKLNIWWCDEQLSILRRYRSHWSRLFKHSLQWQTRLVILGRTWFFRTLWPPCHWPMSWPDWPSLWGWRAGGNDARLQLNSAGWTDNLQEKIIDWIFH